MFGKPQWFTEKKVGWGLKPATWQGWAYSLAAGGIIGLPFAALMATGRAPEGLIWMGATIAALLWDVRKIMAAMRVDQPEEVFVINEETDISSLATRNFDLHLRN